MTLDSRKLNAGCWENQIDGWLNMDVYHRPANPRGAEVVADIREMPFPDGYFEAVLMAHILEHVPYADVLVALREVYRVLAPGGRICVLGPDFDRAHTLWNTGEIDVDMRSAIWPGKSNEDHIGADHQWCATGPNTLELVIQVFPNAVEVDQQLVCDDPYWDARGGPAPWQFAITASK